MDKRIIIIIGAVILAVLFFLVAKRFLFKPDDVVVSYTLGNIADNTTTVDSIVTFSNNTPKASLWKWDFGDNQYDIHKEATHAYTTPGKYRVRLTVTGAFGSATDTTKVITVLARKIVDSIAKPIVVRDTIKKLSTPHPAAVPSHISKPTISGSNHNGHVNGIKGTSSSQISTNEPESYDPHKKK